MRLPSRTSVNRFKKISFWNVKVGRRRGLDHDRSWSLRSSNGRWSRLTASRCHSGGSMLTPYTLRAEPSQLLVKVSVCARFGRAPSSPRDQVPLLRRRGVGPPGVRIHEHDQGPAHVGKLDGSARRGTQRNGREAGSGEMIASPVVEWNWEIRWEGRRRRVRHRLWHTSPPEKAIATQPNRRCD